MLRNLMGASTPATAGILINSQMQDRALDLEQGQGQGEEEEQGQGQGQGVEESLIA